MTVGTADPRRPPAAWVAGVVDAVESRLGARFARWAGVGSTVVCVAIVAWWCTTYGDDGLDWRGSPLGADFNAFWWAARVALTDGPAAAYDVEHAWRGQSAYWPGVQGAFAWVYPPSFLLVVLGLGLLPHTAAFLTWTAATTAPYVAVLRRATPPGGGWLLAGFPGLWLGIGQGQNQFLTATLTAGAVLLLRRHPVLAGVCAGLMAVKPHLAVLLPVAYAAAGAWRAFAAAAVTASGVTLGSAALLGWGTLPAWVQAMGFVGDAIGTGRLPVWKFVSPYTSLVHLGLPGWAAAAGHVVVAAWAVSAVWRVWRRAEEATLRGSALMAATFLATPYSADYDLAWLGLPVAWLAAEALRTGWRRGERLLLAAAYLGVVLTVPATVVPVQTAPLVLAALLWVSARRADDEPSRRGEAGASATREGRRAGDGRRGATDRS